MRSLLRAPDSTPPEKIHSLHLFWLIEGLIALSFTLESLIEIVILPENALRWLLVIIIIDGTALILFWLARAGFVRLAGFLFVVVLWALITGLAITENGVRAPTVDTAYLVTIVVAGLVLDERAGILTGIICVLTLLGLSFAGAAGLLPANQIRRTIFTTWEADVFYLVIVIGLQFLAIHRIREALQQAHQELLHRYEAEASLRKAEEDRAQSQLRVELHRLLGDQLEKERLKIARDLHDGPVQELIGAQFALQALAEESPTETLKQSLLTVQQTLQEQVSSLRGFAGELRSPTLVKFGLAKAIREHLDYFHENHPQIDVQLEAAANGASIPEDIRLTLFRIYQEVMNNIVKHAQASQILVRIGMEEQCIQLEIKDNGIGFTPPTDWMELAYQGHLGLVGMRERAETIGGNLEIITLKNQGTKVWVNIPLNSHADNETQDPPGEM